MLNPPSIIHVHDTDETSSSSTASVSSASSFHFTRFELSRVSHSSSLNTPFDSVDSIFGGDPQSHTDSEWKVNVKNVIKGTEMKVLEGFDKVFLQEDTCDDLYDQTDDEFDAVAAVRARLKRNPPTITTQRALEIIEKRSTSTCDGDDFLASKVVIVDVPEMIEDYTGDFKLGNEEQLEVSVTPKKSGSSALRTVHEEADGGPGFTTPMIRPIDGNWDCHSSFATYNISFSAAAVSQSTVSPLLLDNPMFPSPLLLQEPIFGSPIVSVPSVVFRGRGALRHDIIPKTNSDRWGQGVGLGLVGISTPKAKGVGMPTETGQGSLPSTVVFHGDQDCKPDFMEDATHESGPVNPPEVRLHVDFSEPGVCRRYIPRAPPKTLAYTGLGGININAAAATVIAGSDHPAASEEYINPVVESREKRKKLKSLGLGLPSSLKGTQVRHSSCLPRSGGCQDLARVSMSPEVDESVRVFRRRRLSPIPEEDWAQLLRSPNHERPKKRGLRSRGFIKRALKFLF